MSKTLYAFGHSGAMAIFEGEHLAPFAFPWRNTEKIHFHSDFHYFYKYSEVNETVQLKGLNGSSETGYVDSTFIAEIPYTGLQIPIVLAKINGIEANGSHIIQKNSDKSFRILMTKSTFGENSYNIFLETQAHSHGEPLAPITVSVSYTILFASLQNYFETNDNLLITPERCIFSKGRFDSNREYATINQGGYKYPVGDSISLSDYSFTPFQPAYIEVKI